MQICFAFLEYVHQIYLYRYILFLIGYILNKYLVQIGQKFCQIDYCVFYMWMHAQIRPIL